MNSATMGKATRHAFLALLSAVLLLATVEPKTLVANLNRRGVKGTVTFYQENPSAEVNVTTALTGVDGPYSLEVRQFWTLLDVQDPCSAQLLGNSMASTPEVSGNTTTTAFNGSVSLHGELAIAGQSVVVVKDQVPLACGTLTEPGDARMAIANIRGRVQGTVHFRWSSGSGTRTLVDLYTSDSALTSGTYQWRLHQGRNCSQPGEAYPSWGGTVRVGLGPGGVRQTQLFTTDPGVLDSPRTVRVLGLEGQLVGCGHLLPVRRRRASAVFDADGVKGQITFTQDTPLDPTTVEVSLSNLDRKAGGYHVHEFPVAVRVQRGQPMCGGAQVAGHFNPFGVNVSASPPAGTGTVDQYEVGDLSGKFGMLSNMATFMETYTDSNLPLFGRLSIVGRSLVIHKANTSRWLCANIRDLGGIDVAVAYFRYPAIGYLMLTESHDNPGLTSVYLEVTDAEGLNLTLTSNPAHKDMASEYAIRRCSSTGNVFNPFDSSSSASCGPEAPLLCPAGDLSRKLGFSVPRGAPAKFFGTDVDLSLLRPGTQGVVGRAAVLGGQGVKVACGTLRRVPERHAIADTWGDGVTGTVQMRQRHGLLQTPTTLLVDLRGLRALASGYHVHDLPLNHSHPSPCSNAVVAGHFNPFHVNVSSNYPAPATATLDKYEVGDLSGKFGMMTSNSSWRLERHDGTLSLWGPLSVMGRSLVVHKTEQGARWVCADIREAVTSAEGRRIMARAEFRGILTGSIVMTQYVYRDGSLSDTTVLVDLRYTDNPSRVTENHNWHVHVTPVAGDSEASSGRCQSCGPHYDPFRAKAREDYGARCGPLSPLFCEVGDQSAKLGTYSIGAGRRLFTDTDLPLTGLFAGMGRSVVIHIENRGAARLACADVMPVTPYVVNAVYTGPAINMNDRLAMAAEITQVLPMLPSDVVVRPLQPQAGLCANVQVYFSGWDPARYRRQFEERLRAGQLPHMNMPTTTCAAASLLGPARLVCLLLAVLPVLKCWL